MGGSTSGNGGDHSQKDIQQTEAYDWRVLSPLIRIHKALPRTFLSDIQAIVAQIANSFEPPIIDRVEVMLGWWGSGGTKFSGSVCFKCFSPYGIFSRYYEVIKSSLHSTAVIDSKPPLMDEREISCRANAIVSPYGLKAEVLSDIKSVGVGGDERTYTAVVNLVGTFPGNHVLAELSTKISNALPVNRVTYELSRKIDKECSYNPADKI